VAQYLKTDVQLGLVQAALRVFADRGYASASMKDIAAAAGVTTSNVYRYFENKAVLFDEVLPATLVKRIEALIRARFAHARGHDDIRQPAATAWRSVAAELAALAAQHRLELVILLRHGDGTPYSGFRARLRDTMVELASAHFGCDRRPFLRLVYEQLLSAMATILAEHPDQAELQTLVGAYELYHLAGLREVLG